MVARALHELLEVQGRSAIVGAELLAAMQAITFAGASGDVSFTSGDREAGAMYNVFNFVHGSTAPHSLVKLGMWQSAATWAAQWTQAAGATLTYSTASNSRPDGLAPPSISLLRIGVLCNGNHASLSNSELERCDHYRHAIEVINNKSDGFFDHLLPSTTLVAQYFHIGCSNKPSLAITGHEVLREKFPGFTAGEHAQ